MIDVRITDGQGSTNKVKVTKAGTLATSPPEFSDPVFKEMATDDTAVNFFKPKAGKFLIITSIIIHADKQVGVNGAAVVFFEASDASTSTQDKVVFQTEITSDSDQIITGINWKVSEGKFLNGETNDDDIHANVAGYFVDV